VNIAWLTIARTIRQHRLVAYYLLACAFAWWPWILYARGDSPAVIIGLGPFVAAMIVLAITESRRGSEF
jgi:CAAX protease family protein